MLNYKQFIFAREYRGYSQTELASKVKGLSQSNLSKFEKGISLLSDEAVNKIIDFLDFPKEFFHKRIPEIETNAYYRKRSALTKKEKNDIELSNRLIMYLIDEMNISVEFPDFQVPTIDIEDGFTPKEIAKHIRQFLGLKYDQPVKDICRLLESNGIIIVESPVDSTYFDGVSFMTEENIPVIVINKNFSNDRKRFTIAHELGHIVMHVDAKFLTSKPRDNSRIKEIEANQFAAEFLMPELGIKNELRNLKMSELAMLKKRWMVSMASIMYRAKELGCITDKRYTNMTIEYSRYGYRRKEPVPVLIDAPTLYTKAYDLHKNHLNYSNSELANAFSVSLDIINRFFSFNEEKVRLKVLV